MPPSKPSQENSITAYDRDVPLEEETAQEIVHFFATHYPDMHDPRERASDIGRRAGPDQWNALLDEGRILLISHEFGYRIAGLLEWRPVRVEGGIYAQLTWCITDPDVRGRGVASRLHDYFERQARQIKEATEEPVALQLEVHKDNPARSFWSRRGYQLWSQVHPTNPHKVFMGRELMP